ncbi:MULTISPECIES: hypothetical protein [unclassified Paludibacterium]|uniref:hypothetical protein n=1 Tax=unclassified Paludibacterium TaxID=2618429 RepID=UPI001C045263|nr:hypothetical protein [Paludibacterium sp. B53371]BEV73039.1 hypothetical protein THUN1379_25210 [Paludibacterium sp. THUN1379]
MSGFSFLPTRRRWPWLVLPVLLSYACLTPLLQSWQQAQQDLADSQARLQSRVNRDSRVAVPARDAMDPALWLVLRLEQSWPGGLSLLRLESDSGSRKMQLTLRSATLAEVMDWINTLRKQGLHVSMLSQQSLITTPGDPARLEIRLEVAI